MSRGRPKQFEHRLQFGVRQEVADAIAKVARKNDRPIAYICRQFLEIGMRNYGIHLDHSPMNVDSNGGAISS